MIFAILVFLAFSLLIICMWNYLQASGPFDFKNGFDLKNYGIAILFGIVASFLISATKISTERTNKHYKETDVALHYADQPLIIIHDGESASLVVETNNVYTTVAGPHPTKPKLMSSYDNKKGTFYLDKTAKTVWSSIRFVENPEFVTLIGNINDKVHLGYFKCQVSPDGQHICLRR